MLTECKTGNQVCLLFPIKICLRVARVGHEFRTKVVENFPKTHYTKGKTTNMTHDNMTHIFKSVFVYILYIYYNIYKIYVFSAK